MRTELQVWMVLGHSGVPLHWYRPFYRPIIVPQPYQAGGPSPMPWRDHFNDDHALDHKLR